ncbi:Protein of unknown function [Bacillus mycoides]|uniref:Uncharacterized protein n=1 Tax=Bacillus mycoides TaxID=1405 RepID=A0A1C4FTV3_BACMY|nr:Protein of unknown function [Bacillus mycoides]SCC59400.1 Protein of unknown function [Bacillus mycoides]
MKEEIETEVKRLHKM